MRFVGAIAFLDSAERINDNRSTNVMPFTVMVDWVKSVTEFFTQYVSVGDYDGTEILVTVYEYKGDAEDYAPVSDWDYDSDNLIDVIRIKNPWYV